MLNPEADQASSDVVRVDEIRNQSVDVWVDSQKRELAVSSAPVQALALGARDDVREIAERIMFMHPDGRKVGRAACYAAAQLARMVGASFLPGTNEIHFWYNDKRKVVQITLGINYFRRRSLELGGILWLDQPRLMTPVERQKFEIPSGAVAGYCRAVRVHDVREYKSLGFEPKDILSMCAREGIATAASGDYAKSGRPLSWTVLKNAELDLYRALFPNLYSVPDNDWKRANQGYDVVPPPEITEQFVDLDAVETELAESVSVIDDEPVEPLSPLPDELAFLDSVPDSQDLLDMTQEEFQSALCADLRFRHWRHVENALDKTLPDWQDRALSRSQIWALAKFYRRPPTLDHVDSNQLLLGIDPSDESE